MNVYDSPGLQDGRQGDRSYILKMAKKCSTPSLLIYCTKMRDPIKPHEKEALGNLVSAFGENVWKKFVIALTFANEVRPPRRKYHTVYFHDIMARKKKALRVCFKELGKERVFDEQIARRIFPVGSEDEVDLPTVQNWQEEFKKNCVFYRRQKCSGYDLVEMETLCTGFRCCWCSGSYWRFWLFRWCCY